MANDFSQTSTIDLLKILLRELKILLEESGSLMKLEMKGKMREVRKGLLSLLIGGVLAYMGLWAAIGTLIFGIAVFVPLWMAAGIITIAVLGGGGLFLYKGIQTFKDFDPKPERTFRTLKEINHVLTRPF